MPEHRKDIETDDASQDSAGSSAPQPEIHIEIDAKGNIVLETVGTTGNQCDLLSGALENSLGSITARLNKKTYNNGQITIQNS